MLLSILGWVTGLAGPISQITNKILDLKKQRLDAESNIQKAKIDQEIEAANDRRMVLVAEAQHKFSAGFNAFFRGFLALPAGLLLWKVIVWDKVIGSFKGCARGGPAEPHICYTFNTDDLSAALWGVVAAIYGFYFIHSLWSKK